MSYTGQILNEDDPATPCGLVAKSFFLDKFTLKKKSGETIAIDAKNIAWESDKQYKFKNVEKAGER